MDKICRDFMEHRCKREKCKFIHDKNLCYHYWRGNCKFGEKCRKNHFVSQRNRPKNTESFEPSHNPPDMRIIIEPGIDERSYSRLSTRDVLVVFNHFNDSSLFERLLSEIEGCPIDDLWKSWHGDTHMIADDKMGWKKYCPTFNWVVEKMAYYLDMNVEATRFNWYRNTSDWKPFHHDSAAVKKDKAAVQNFTAAISFGTTREAAFQENQSKKVISLPLRDGMIYCFGRDVNIMWKHGILQLPPEQQTDEQRISIIVWGWKEQQET